MESIFIPKARVFLKLTKLVFNLGRKNYIISVCAKGI